ncbi:telomere repeats-binding bouquet formation protein 2 [Anoplopoma fimbria]|uniref:telomere repeats-binding bouquet formation protein 2 n=1 Tax=Anoplopoma fimbria TaxID=229290 RepID=UPI0023EE1124|nr:telomere repeats-binding bouquet formation protein 2 [Anoplopoma fimbria]
MFRDKSAWFSSSVPQACHNFWILEGGTDAGWRTADYLFSEDATCADTLRIFESKDYLWNKVAVFHSLFLSGCEKRQSVRSVCIGHYVLPPASIQEEVRHVVGRLIWECEDEQPVAKGFHKSFSCQTEDENSEDSRSDSEPSDTDLSESEAPLHAHYAVSNTLSGYVSIDNLQKYSCDLCDFHLGCFRCSSCKAHCCPPHT